MVIVQYPIETLCINVRYHGVKRTGSLVGGSEGGQSPNSYISTSKTHEKFMHNRDRLR